MRLKKKERKHWFTPSICPIDFSENIAMIILYYLKNKNQTGME